MKWEMPERACYVIAILLTALFVFLVFTYLAANIEIQQQTYARDHRT